MKPLKPSMKENKRYLLIKGKNLKINIEKAILEFVGALGHSKASPNVVKSGKDSLVLSVNRNSLNHIRASFAAFQDKIEVVRVSGTLKSLGKK